MIRANEESQKIIDRGLNFLEKECKNGFYKCYIADSREMTHDLHVSPPEVGSSVLILLTALKDKQDSELTRITTCYLKNHIVNGRFNFFEDRTLLPEDTDTTSCSLSVLLELNEIDKELVDKTTDDIIRNVDRNGIIQVWFEPCVPKINRTDHIAATNALHLVNLLGKSEEVRKTENYVFESLKSRRYLNGSRYYTSPDIFLYSLSRLLVKSHRLEEQYRETLGDELLGRIGTTEYPLDLAIRTTTAKRLGISNEYEIKKLSKLQNQDGSWPIDAFCSYGSKIGCFGSKSIVTAFAIEALK